MSLATRALKNQHYHPPIWILSLVTTQFRLLRLCSSGGIEDTVNGMVALVVFISLLVSILPSGDSRRRVASEAELQNRFSVRPRDFRFRHKLNSTCQFWKEELSHRNIDVHNVMDSINDTLSQIEEQLVRIKSIVSTKALVRKL